MATSQKGKIKNEKGSGTTALYIRVSTDAQFEEGYSVDAQKNMLAAYCESRQISRYAFFVDGGFSGSNIERPEVQRLIKYAKEGRIDRVVVYKLDRLSRSQKDTLFLIEDVFLPHNVDFVSLQESMDTSTAYGRAMIGILSAFAQLERENIRERTRMGMLERVKEGNWMGGGRTPYGYDYDQEEGILVPNQDAETVRKIYDLYLQGYSSGRIANIVGLKYDRLVIQILQRKSNTGIITFRGTDYKGKHEPIVSAEIFAKVQELMKERSVKHVYNSCYLLSGLIYCGKCGARMRYQKWGGDECKLSCYSQQKSKQYLIKDPNCKNAKPWAADVEKAVIDNLLSFSLQMKNNDGQNPFGGRKPVSALDNMQQQLEACKTKIKRLYALYAEDGNELLLESIEAMKKNMQALTSHIEMETNRDASQQKQSVLIEAIKSLADVWPHATQQEKQNLIRHCIEKVVIDGSNVQIFFKLENVTAC